jgi:hypothetical protein
MDPKLFTIAKNTKAEELKKYVSVSVNFNIKTIFPAMAMVEKRTIIPAIGQPLFDDVAAYYADPATQTEHAALYAELLECLQCAVARLSYADAYSEISMKLDDSGATVPHDKENRPYRYQEENLKRDMRLTGFEALDNAMRLCEDHIDVLSKYEESPWRKKAMKSLVRNTQEFGEVFDIEGSRLVFMRMTYFIRLVEEIHLSHRIGADFLEDIIADRESIIYAPFLSHLMKYVVYKSVAVGIDELMTVPTDRGIMVEEMSGDGKNVKQLPGEEIIRLKERYNGYAESYIQRAIEYMNAHVNDYPKYKEYCGETNPGRNLLKRDNNKKKIFVV